MMAEERLKKETAAAVAAAMITVTTMKATASTAVREVRLIMLMEMEPTKQMRRCWK